jgi:hypothetical protein
MEPQRFMGDAVSTWRPNMHVANPMRDGLGWFFGSHSVVHALWPMFLSQFMIQRNITYCKHALVDQMKETPSEHPVIVTEAPWNTPENRQRMAQIMFEEYSVPAFYIANTAVLSS